MDPGQKTDHSSMRTSHMDMSQMDHGDGAGSSCCDPQHAAAPGDCAWLMKRARVSLRFCRGLGVQVYKASD